MPSYRFGPFSVDEEDRLLLRDGDPVPLTDKTFALLLLLVRRAGRVVSKDEILKTVWPGDEVVEEWNITQQVYALRKALGDTGRSRLYVETVPRRGFRFVGKPERGSAEPPAPAPVAYPDIRQISFRRGSVFRARFAPGDQGVVYGAAFEGASAGVFMAGTAGGSPESRPLGLGDADLLAVSGRGELALSLRERTLRGYVRGGTLGVTSLFGGAPPREVAGSVHEADWDAEGRHLAIIREEQGRTRLEYPPGELLHETEGWLSHARFSPGGDLIAFIDHPLLNDDRGSVWVVGSKGGVRRLTREWFSAQGLAWSPEGDEVWFTASESGNHRALRAAGLGGSERVLYRMAAALTLQDVSRDGRVLLVRQNTRVGIVGKAPGSSAEVDLSWLDWSLARDLSEDGHTLLFTEAGEGGGDTYGVYLRKTDNSPAVRLGDGSALALSPDGRWALSRTTAAPLRLVLLPTGPGSPVPLAPATLNYQQWACWLTGGDGVLFSANAPGRGSQLYLQDLAGGPARCVTPDIEGIYLTTPKAISPDGTKAAAVGPDGLTLIFDLYGDKGKTAETLGLGAGYSPIRWAPDGESLYVYRCGEVPAKVRRVCLRTGAVTPMLDLIPPDPVGVVEFLRVLLTPNAEAYAYTYTRDLSDLYLVSGLA